MSTTLTVAEQNESGHYERNAMNTFKIVDSPIGGLVLVARGGRLVGLYHEYHSPEPSPVLLGLPFVNASRTPHPAGADPGATSSSNQDAALPVFRETTRWLRSYFSGEVLSPIAYELVHGTNFQRSVWHAVAGIPYGQTRTYKDIAGALGNESMGRAVGAAVRANPLSVVIPGHRVVGAGGAVTGYAAGVGVKRALLELEAAVAAAGSAA